MGGSGCGWWWGEGGGGGGGGWRLGVGVGVGVGGGGGCKFNCAPGGILSKTRLASCSGGILAIHWRMLASRSGSILSGYSAGSAGKDTQHTGRDPLASRSGAILGGIQAALAGYLAGSTGGGIHWRAALAGYWGGSTNAAGSTDELLRHTRPDPLPSCSGRILGGGVV